MTTKEYLGQITKLNGIIMNRMKEICEMKDAATSVSSLAYDKDKIMSSGNKNQIEYNVSKIVDLERQLEVFVNLKYKIIQQIESLESDEYNVLYLRYVNNLTFSEICDQLNQRDVWSESRMYKAHKQGLIDFEERFGYGYM